MPVPIFPRTPHPTDPNGALGGERKAEHKMPSEFAGANGGNASESLAEGFSFLKQDKIIGRVR